MTTKRHPVRPPSRLHITPEAVAAFRIMERARLRCTCKDTDNADSCPACRRWWRAHAVLHDSIGLPPWWFPACWGEGDERPEARVLYLALAEAAGTQSL